MTPVARLALALTAWTERWVPDAFIFALIATLVVFLAALIATPSTADPDRRCVGPRLLGSDPLHAADVAGDHHRSRARDVAADGCGHPDGRRLAAHAARRRRARHVLRPCELVDQLGLQPDLQRRARARSRAARERRRLSGARRRELSRPRQHLGAGAQRLRRPADGDTRRAPAADPRHRRARRRGAGRHHPVPPHDFSVAVHRRPCSSKSSW